MRINHILLLEYNIINIPDLENWLELIVNKINFPQGQDWLRKKGRIYLINEIKTSSRIHNLTPNAPEWMSKRYSEGVELYRFSPDREIENKLNHITDWLNSLHVIATTNQPKSMQNLVDDAKSLLPKINKISVDDATAHADKWFDKINNTKTEIQNSSVGTEHVLDTEHGTWVELTTQEALSHEGKIMGHCVGGGGYCVGTDSKTRIFSLRDQKGESFVTIEVHRYENSVQQIKGKQNRPPVAKYHDDVIAFLNHMQFDMDSHDANEIGILYSLKLDVENDTYKTHYHKLVDKEPLSAIDGFKFIRHDAADGQWTKPAIHIEKNRQIYGSISFVKSDYYRDSVVNDYRMVDKFNLSQGLTKEEIAETKIAAIGFLNSLTPIPKPSYSFHDLIYSPKKERYYATSNEIREKVLSYEGYDIFSYEVNERTLYEFVENNEKLFVIKNENDILSAARNEWVKLKAIPSKILLKILKELELNHLTTSNDLKNCGIWGHKGELILFNPETLGFIKITDDVFGDNKSSVFYNKLGQWMGTLNDQGTVSINQDVNITEQRSDKEWGDIFTKNSINLAVWFNKIGKHYPTGTHTESLLNFRRLGLLKNKKEWVSILSGKVVKTEGNIRILSIAKILSVVVGDDIVIMANVQKDSYTNEINVQTIEGKSKQEAMLALSRYAVEKESTLNGGSNYRTLLTSAEVMIDPKDNNSLVKVTDIYPKKTIKKYEDSVWERVASMPIDARKGMNYPRNIPNANNYVLYTTKTDDKKLFSCRVYCSDDKKIRLITIVNKGKLFNVDEELHEHYVPYISDLISEENLKGSEYVSSLGFMIRDNKLTTLQENPRMEDFVKGKIVYEDGHTWTITAYKQDSWTLTLETNQDGKHRTVPMVEVEINNGGVKSIHLKDSNLRWNPKSYMDYVHDLMDLFKEKNYIS